MRKLLGIILLSVGCALPKPPVPIPTPKPTPSPTPTPTPIACQVLQSFKLDTRHLARVIVDATPGNGFPSCDSNVGTPCTNPGSFSRLSPEGGSNQCEVLAGPYTWTLNGEACNGAACNVGGNCFSNNNPLQYVICKSGVVGVKGGNGATSIIPVNVP